MENKKKTALQEAIDKIQRVLDLRGVTKFNENECDGYEFGLIESNNLLQSLLQKEKDDLIEAFEVGYGSGISELGTNYYTETFEQ
jgi:hypothetical protein